MNVHIKKRGIHLYDKVWHIRKRKYERKNKQLLLSNIGRRIGSIDHFHSTCSSYLILIRL